MKAPTKHLEILGASSPSAHSMDTLITLTIIIIPYPCPTLDKEAQNLNSPARVPPRDACRRKEYSLLEFISSSCLLPFEARNLFFPPVVNFLMGEGKGRPLTCNYQKLLPFTKKSLNLSQMLTESSPPDQRRSD
ncbi:unnamed protein product, partial [Gulo gulo]